MIVALVVVAALLAILVAVVLAAQPPRLRSGGDLRMHRVADDVFLYRGYFSNSAVLVLPEGVVVVDTQVSPRAGARLRDAIRAVTDKPIALVVNTHYHGDHTGGNAAFPGVPVIGTALCARYCDERDEERVAYATTFGLAFQEVHPTIAPTDTFDGRREIAIAGDAIVVEQIGASETPDCCVVRWPSRGVVCVGDGVATIDYPFLGVPFMDEGLRDDGAWTGFLRALVAMRPRVLLPGHGPAIVGEARVRARLELLRSLFDDLLASVRDALARGTPTPEIVRDVDAKLAHYRRRRELREHATGQHFAIYRCVNNLTPSRKGRGWWHDLRPSAVKRAPREAIAEALARATSSEAIRAEAERLAPRRRPEAITLLEAWIEAHPDDAAALALLSEIFFDGAQPVTPKVDATEFFVEAVKVARRALAIDPDAPRALLTLGCAEVFGAMVLAQDMNAGTSKIDRALASGTLPRAQRMKARFFLAKAHQMELRDADADREFRAMFPAWARFWAFPLLRARLRATP